MTTDDLAPKSNHGPGSDARWALVERIAASPRFARAAQLRNFLLYVSRRLLADRAVEISEQEIGVNVFHRRANFNPNEDNIVRVQARQLRRKLEEYFAEEGREQELVVTIPKGSYVPEFGPRIRIEQEQNPSKPTGSARWAVVALSVLVVVLATVSVLLWSRLRAAREPAFRGAPLWARVFADRQKTNVVVGDANLLIIEDFVRRDVSLEEYLSREYPENLLSTANSDQVRPILKIMSSWRNSWFGDFGLASLILDESRQYSGRPALRFPNGLNIGELKMDNFVMLGSRRSIPWVQLFDAQLRYALEYDPQTEQWIQDKSSGAERTGYRVVRDKNGVRETYAAVALVPNLNGRGTILLLQGLTTAATEGAVQFLSRPDFDTRLRGTQGCSTVDVRTDSFELLLRTKPVAGAPLASEVLACRPVPPALGGATPAP